MICKIQIGLVVDEESIEQECSGSITGVLYWRVDAQCFPDDRWNDFIVKILSWWLKAIAELLQGAETSHVLDFMDGPFSVHCRASADSVVCEFIDSREGNRVVASWRGHIRELGQAVVDAGSVVLRGCHVRRVSSPDVASLQHELKKLGGLMR